MQVVTDLLECPVEQPHHRWDQRCVGQQAEHQVSSSRAEFLSGSNGSEVVSLASAGVSLLIAVINSLL